MNEDNIVHNTYCSLSAGRRAILILRNLYEDATSSATDCRERGAGPGEAPAGHGRQPTEGRHLQGRRGDQAGTNE